MLSSFKQSGGAKHREKRPKQIPPPLTLHNPGLTITPMPGDVAAAHHARAQPGQKRSFENLAALKYHE